MEVDELEGYFRANWTEIKSAIENGTFQPSKVLGVEIDKLDGGKRLLGIPTAIDRVIQQMIHRVLSPVYDVEFSTYSYDLFVTRMIVAFLSRVNVLPEGYLKVSQSLLSRI